MILSLFLAEQRREPLVELDQPLGRARTSSWVMEGVSIRWHDPMTNRSVSQLRALNYSKRSASWQLFPLL